MDPREEQIRKVINLFREQGLTVKPEASGLERILSRLDVTDSSEVRYNYQEVSIISPFYQYMSSTMKVLVSLVVVALLVGGVAYFKLSGPNGGELGKTITPTDEGVLSDADIQVASGGDEDIGALLSSLGQEQSEEKNLLAADDADVAAFTDESSLLGEVNQTYQDAL